MYNRDNRLEMILKNIVILVLIKYINGQEMLENARCNEYPDRGTCEDRGFSVKWYYDRYSHRCRRFHYGGCGGNENRFDSFEECSGTCKFESLDEPWRRCIQPHDPGHCDGHFQRWHFDTQLRQCVCSFWSGCGGNSNMFYSYAHCMSVCGIYANNRSSETKTTFRRSIPASEYHQIHRLNHASSSKEGRQQNSLVASLIRESTVKLRRRHDEELQSKKSK